MDIKLNSERALQVGTELIKAYKKNGILGIRRLPDDVVPKGLIGGSPEHLLFLTFSSFISYRQVATKFWANARKAYQDPETNLIFLPEKLKTIDETRLEQMLSKYSLLNNRPEAVKIWMKVGSILYEDFNSNPLDIFHNNDYSITRIFKYMNSQVETLFPKDVVREREFLLWIMRIRFNTGLVLENLKKISLPVTFHTMRATLNTGVISGKIRVKTIQMVRFVQKVWADACTQGQNNEKFVPLDFEKFLWTLSRYGCMSFKKNGKCQAKKICPVGKFECDGEVLITNDQVSANIEI